MFFKKKPDPQESKLKILIDTLEVCERPYKFRPDYDIELNGSITIEDGDNSAFLLHSPHEPVKKVTNSDFIVRRILIKDRDINDYYITKIYWKMREEFKELGCYNMTFRRPDGGWYYRTEINPTIIELRACGYRKKDNNAN